MAFEELDSLFNDMTEADKTAMKGILERNAPAATRLTQQNTVYTAFVDGDTAALATLTTPKPPPVVSSPASVDLDALNRSLDARFDKIYEDPRFNTAVEARAKTIAEGLVAKGIETAVGRSVNVADDIFTIRASHREEFGEVLDRKPFEDFFVANAPKFGNSLTVAYDAYVAEKRIQKRVDAARAEGAAATATREVPGVSQPGASSPAGMFIKSNPMNNGAAADRGTALDAAAAAFRSLQQARVN
jgi:hypothetical protein